MRGTKIMLSLGIAAMALGALSSDALSSPADLKTTTKCTTSHDCQNGEYCNYSDGFCYLAVGVQCNFSTDCPQAGAYCHSGRCHAGSIPCINNDPCPSRTYCHFGLCHSEACNSDFDCPVGVRCITSIKTCALP